jgi:hypothetical protein
MRHQEYRRHDQRAEGIDVPDRIETDAAEVVGGIVTETMGDIAVGGFVKGDGDHERQDPDGEVVESDVHGGTVPV